MNIDSLFSMSQFGLTYERLRMEAAIRNISQANTPLAAGESPMRAQATSFAGLTSELPQVRATQVPAETREVHDPGNPLADANGDVRYANVDMVTEMTDLMSASRAYEANVRSINTLEQMNEKALQIGGR